MPRRSTRTPGRACATAILLSGAKLRELDPELPPCYERAGIELARVRIWPGMKALQLKLVLHSQDASCECSIRKGPDAGRLRQARARCIREALDRTGPRPTEAPGASGVRDAEGHEGALPAGIAPRAAGITAEAHLHCPARFGPQRDVHAAASGRARPASGIDGRAFLPRGQHPPDRSAEPTAEQEALAVVTP